MPLDPAVVYRALISQERQSLPSLPRTHGIYALFDHAGEMRYVGITAGDRNGFYGRINNRHVAGSESRSHKFSHAYNTGRMWRAKGGTGADAKLAKALRTLFARRYCLASVVPVEIALHADLLTLEAVVQALAPAGQLLWLNKRGFEPYGEHVDLVESLVRAQGFTMDQRAALDRQSARFALAVS